MPVETVQCTRRIALPAPRVWAWLGDFDVGWHPDISACKVAQGVDGARIREFRAQDGSTYTERRTWISDSDMSLGYTALSGIDGADRYRARVSVAPEGAGACTVLWIAEIGARADRLAGIAAGTRAVFERGLDWLAAAPGREPPGALPRPASAPVGRLTLEGTPALSVLAGGGLERAETLVLFLHGIGGNAANWQPQLERFGAEHAVAALDMRGYGGSTLGFAPSTIDDYCEDILRVAAHFGAERLILAGLSMGAWIANSFAMRHPDRLAGLVLAGGCTGMSEAGPEERESFRIAREVPLSQGQTPADFAPAVAQAIAGPDAPGPVRQTLHASMAAIPPESYRDALRCFCNPLERFDFTRISCPVLLMTGAFDRLAQPEEIRAVAQRIHEAPRPAGQWPDLRFEVIASAGHVCNLEAPEPFNARLAEFLAGRPGTRRRTDARAERRDAKRQRILDAARAEFCQRGFDGASMQALARRAGVSKPTLYQYFGSKDGLFAAMLEQGRAQITAPLARLEGALVDRLWDFAWTYADFVLRPDMLSLARLILGEAERRPESAAAYYQGGPARAFADLVRFVEDAVRAAELQTDAPDLAAQDLWSLILSGPRDRYLHHVNLRPDKNVLGRAIGHGLDVFLQVYSTAPEADRDALRRKLAALAANGDVA